MSPMFCKTKQNKKEPIDGFSNRLLQSKELQLTIETARTMCVRVCVHVQCYLISQVAIMNSMFNFQS